MIPTVVNGSLVSSLPPPPPPPQATAKTQGSITRIISLKNFNVRLILINLMVTPLCNLKIELHVSPPIFRGNTCILID
jgi:hypothetical protein